LAYGRYVMGYFIPTYLYYLTGCNKAMITVKQTIISWVLLISLTLASVYADQVMENNVLFIMSVLLIVFLKGQQITDIFMELREAPKMWRMLLLSYVLIIPVVICTIYLL